MATTPCPAELKMPPIFGSHMVLQRDTAVPVWGTAAPGQTVTVTFAGQRATARAGKSGRWIVRLKPMAASATPAALTVSAGKGRRRFTDVLVGEVWFASGQSNAAMGLAACVGGKAAAAAAGKYPLIRLNRRGAWEVNSPESALRFGAVAYWFGLDLHQALGVPVGMINRAWGGRPIAAFVRPEGLAQDPVLKRLVVGPWQRYARQYDQRKATWKKTPKNRRAARLPAITGAAGYPGAFWDHEMAGIVPYAIRGVTWYQGESDSWGFAAADLYARSLKAMIADWRSQWGRPKLPFVVMQLPNGPADVAPRPHQPGPWHVVQEAQALAARRIDHVATAVIIDTGASDVHPQKKRHAGDRLARAALASVYGRDIVGSGPVYRSMKVTGEKVRLRFDHVGGGLVAHGGRLRGFALAGEDRMFFWAEGKIEGDSIVLRSKDVPKPVAARYCLFGQSPWSLKNAAGLLASPFRTDQWSPDIPPMRRRTLSCPRASVAPAAGASLGDAPWKTAGQATGLTHLHTYRKGLGVRVLTTRDDEHLYFAFRCPEPDLRGGGAAKFLAKQPAQPDKGFWKGDWVEVLIDANADRKSYYRFAVNPAGAVYTARAFNDAVDDTDIIAQDMLAAHRWIDDKWSCPVKVESKLRDAWTVKIAIPFQALGLAKPKAGTKLGAQFHWRRSADGSVVEWATTGRDRNTGAMMPPRQVGGITRFHSPSRFGTLILK